MSVLFDMIVGTSAGGIVAIALGLGGLTVTNCLAMISEITSDVFAQKLVERALSATGFVLGKPHYKLGKLKVALDRHLPAVIMADADSHMTVSMQQRSFVLWFCRWQLFQYRCHL